MSTAIAAIPKNDGIDGTLKMQSWLALTHPKEE
jgi:hypothetical protein